MKKILFRLLSAIFFCLFFIGVFSYGFTAYHGTNDSYTKLKAAVQYLTSGGSGNNLGLFDMIGVNVVQFVLFVLFLWLSVFLWKRSSK